MAWSDAARQAARLAQRSKGVGKPNTHDVMQSKPGTRTSATNTKAFLRSGNRVVAAQFKGGDFMSTLSAGMKQLTRMK